MKAKVDVKNVPEYAIEFAYWVARKDEHGQLWFYGAWNDIDAACKIANQVDGVVVEVG